MIPAKKKKNLTIWENFSHGSLTMKMSKYATTTRTGLTLVHC